MLVSEVIGNLGYDAQVKEFGGRKYVSMSVAHSVFSKDQNGNRQESTVWVSVLWYGEGGGVFQYLKKGAKVFVRGRQSIKLYQDRQGVYQYAINIDATEVAICGFKQDEARSFDDRSQQSGPSKTNQYDEIFGGNSHTGDLPY